MIKLKAHNKPISEFTEIDKYLLVPKKLWDDVLPGEIEIFLEGKKMKLRVYNVPCSCVPQKHQHRIIDVRDIWDSQNLKANQEVKIEK